MRVMITLIDAGGQPLSVTDISNQANINQQSFYNNEELLLEYNLIEKADKIGNATRYKTNLEEPHVQALMDLYDTMIDQQ